MKILAEFFTYWKKWIGSSVRIRSDSSFVVLVLLMMSGTQWGCRRVLAFSTSEFGNWGRTEFSRSQPSTMRLQQSSRSKWSHGLLDNHNNIVSMRKRKRNIVPALTSSYRVPCWSVLSATTNDDQQQTAMSYSGTASSAKFASPIRNDTAILNSVGTPVTNNDVRAVTSDVTSTVLAIDPANLEIIPLSSAPFLSSQDHSPTSAVDEQEGAAVQERVEIPPFVKMFRGSASYIANHRNTIAVYHIPGELLELDHDFPSLMDDIALTWLLGMKIVIVVGCRHQIDQRMEHCDITGHPVDLCNRIRVTDIDTLRVVKEEAGFVRFEVERQLARSLKLHGGTGNNGGGGSESDNGDLSRAMDGNVVSGNFFSAQPFGVIDGVDYMYTGFPRRIETDKIRQIHASDDIVLLTPLGYSPSGEIFNVNSECLAAQTAGALGASKIIYLTVHGAVMRKLDTNKTVQNIRLADGRKLLDHHGIKVHRRGFVTTEEEHMPTDATITNNGMQHNILSNGATENDHLNNGKQSSPLVCPAQTEMLLKIGWSTFALEKGVRRAHIIAPTGGALLQELYTRDGSGTLISRDLYEGIRPANVNDVAGIYDLIHPLVRLGTLIPRSRSTLEKDIRSYFVYTRDNLVVATGQLKQFDDLYAEIGCLVVSPDYRSQGRGDAMLGYLERLCLQSNIRNIFVLSTQTMEWFAERDFRLVSVDDLPPTRKAIYNHKRKSKIYMKTIRNDRDLDEAELWWNR